MRESLWIGYEWDPCERIPHVLAREVRFEDDEMTVTMLDGRKVTVPVDWIPWLAEATPEERDRWGLMGVGGAIVWDDLDEELWVRSLFWDDPEKIRAEQEDGRNRLRRLVDEIEEEDIPFAERFFAFLRGTGTLAPYDDEPLSEEEKAGLEEARKEPTRVPLEQIEEELGWNDHDP